MSIRETNPPPKKEGDAVGAGVDGLIGAAEPGAAEPGVWAGRTEGLALGDVFCTGALGAALGAALGVPAVPERSPEFTEER